MIQIQPTVQTFYGAADLLDEPAKPLELQHVADIYADENYPITLNPVGDIEGLRFSYQKIQYGGTNPIGVRPAKPVERHWNSLFVKNSNTEPKPYELQVKYMAPQSLTADGLASWR